MIVDFLAKLIDKATCWCPRFKIIDPEMNGVKITRGVYRKTLEMGMYWYWPLISSIETIVVSSQIKLFDTQMMTMDGETIEVVCDAIYTVEKPATALLRWQDFDDTLASYAENYLGEYICTHTLNDMLGATNDEGEYIGVHQAIRDYVYDKLEIIADKCGLSLTEINVRAFCKMYRVKTGV